MRAASPTGTCRSSTIRAPSDSETRPQRQQIPPASRPLAHLHLALHSVAYSNKIRFDPLANKFGINIQAVAHGSAAVQDLRLGSVSEEETEVAGEDFVNIAEPGASIVLRHKVQFDEHELGFRQSLFRARQHLFFVTLDVDFQKRNFREIDQ